MGGWRVRNIFCFGSVEERRHVTATVWRLAERFPGTIPPSAISSCSSDTTLDDVRAASPDVPLLVFGALSPDSPLAPRTALHATVPDMDTASFSSTLDASVNETRDDTDPQEHLVAAEWQRHLFAPWACSGLTALHGGTHPEDSATRMTLLRSSQSVSHLVVGTSWHRFHSISVSIPSTTFLPQHSRAFHHACQRLPLPFEDQLAALYSCVPTPEYAPPPLPPPPRAVRPRKLPRPGHTRDPDEYLFLEWDRWVPPHSPYHPKFDVATDVLHRLRCPGVSANHCFSRARPIQHFWRELIGSPFVGNLPFSDIADILPHLWAACRADPATVGTLVLPLRKLDSWYFHWKNPFGASNGHPGISRPWVGYFVTSHFD
ncbi:hypothetical protein RI054_42g149660 [Pseudoscourfieldia marina]